MSSWRQNHTHSNTCSQSSFRHVYSQSWMSRRGLGAHLTRGTWETRWTQTLESADSVLAAPAVRQGRLAHSSTSRSQCSPAKPAAHTHRYPFTRSWHTHRERDIRNGRYTGIFTQKIIIQQSAWNNNNWIYYEIKSLLCCHFHIEGDT